MPLPRLVQAFARVGCFTLDEAVGATGDARKAVLKGVEYLRSRGYLETVRRGLYALDPGKSVGVDPDPLVIGAKVVDPYLLSYHSALELHGVAESAFFRRVAVATPKTFAPFGWRDYEFRAVAIDSDILAAGRSTIKRSGTKLAVASPELTVIQCADRPELAGGISEVLASVRGLPYLDWSPLLRLLELHDKTVLYRKVGYLVAANADRWRPPGMVLRTLRERLGTSTTYFGVEPRRGGRHEPDWHVIVPPDAPEVTADA
jgi:predicted transcriptional regulator of viral defense system